MLESIIELAQEKVINERIFRRYVKFIDAFGKPKKEEMDELHHILPKASDMFPQYTKLKEHRWNGVYLSPRAHFIAHILAAKCFGGSQIYAIVQMIHKKNNVMTNRKDVKVNSVLYESLKKEWISKLKECSTGKTTYVDERGKHYYLSKEEARSLPVKVLLWGFATFRFYENSLGERIKLFDGEDIPDGFAHINSSKAAYVGVDGNIVQLRTDDPRISSGEYVAHSRGRKIKDSVKAYYSDRYKDTVNIVLEDGEKLRIKKDELHLLCRPYKLNHGAGVKRNNTENYKKAALERKSKTCGHCGKSVKINLFYRWHGDNCKANAGLQEI